MKINELIEELETIRNLHNNLDVTISSEPGIYPPKFIFDIEVVDGDLYEHKHVVIESLRF